MKLKISNLSKSYDDKEVLKDINFTFEKGKIYGLLGRNGAGKTTFFNALTEAIEIESGKFILEESKNRKLTNQDIGYVTATPIVPEFLTAREFLQFYLEINKNRIKNLKNLDYYFDLVKIAKKDQDILLKEYSHGMKNKIQMLVNIIINPKIILLDEPLTALDIVAQEEIKKMFQALKDNHIIIFSTHILELAIDLCDEIVVLNNKNLELISKESLNTKKYKDKIIAALKEDSDA